MPTVPEYKVPQVSLRPVGTNQSNVRATPQDFGSDVAKGLSALAETSDRLNQEKAAREAMDVFREYEEKHFLKQQEYKSRLGRDAQGVYDDARTFVSELENEALGKLSNNKSREAFQKLFNPTRSSGLKDIARHDAVQRFEYGKQIEKGIDANSLQGIAANYNNPEMIDAYLESSWISTQANNTHLDPQDVPQLQLEKNTGFFKEMVDQFKNAKRGREGLAMLERYKGQINPDAYDNFKAELEGVSIREKVQEAADSIMSMKIGDAEQLDYIRKNYSGEEEDQIIQEVKTRQADRKRIKNETIYETTRDLQTSILNIQNQTGTGIEARSTINQQLDLANNIPDPQARAAQIRQINQKAMGQDTVTDPVVWSAYLRMSTEDPNKFKNHIIERDLDKLSPSDFQMIRKWQEDIKAGKGGETQAQIRSTINDISNREMKGIGASDADKALFVRKVWEQALQEGAESQADIQKIVNSQIANGEIYRKYWFNKNARAFEAGPDQLFIPEGSTKLDEIPANEKRDIIDALKERGIGITEENILMVWTGYQGKDN